MVKNMKITMSTVNMFSVKIYHVYVKRERSTYLISLFQIKINLKIF